MTKKRLLWIDFDADAANAFSCALPSDASFALSYFAKNAREGREMIAVHRPDVIVTELILPGGDGFSVLSRVREIAGYDPVVIVSSFVRDGKMMEKCKTMGADGYEVRPVSPMVICARIEGTLRRKGAGRAIEKDVLHLADRALAELGMPVSLTGFSLVREAVAMAAKEKDPTLRRVTGTVYPALARANGMTAAAVERAVRSAIEATWIRGSVAAIEQSFGYTVSEQKGKPTNSEFIAMLAARIRQERNN